MQLIKLIYLFSNIYIISGKITKSDSESYKSDNSQRNDNSKIIKKNKDRKIEIKTNENKLKMETNENKLKKIFYKNTIIYGEEYEYSNKIVNKDFKWPLITNNYFYIQNINDESLKLLKELIVNVLKEISIEELFKNNSKKENSDNDENSESDKESKIPFLFNSIFSDKNDKSNDSDNQIPLKGKIFLADLILITGLKQYVNMKRQNQNHLLKQRI